MHSSNFALNYSNIKKEYILNYLYDFTQAFQEFVETFTDVPVNKTGKVWVKAGTYDAGKRRRFFLFYL